MHCNLILIHIIQHNNVTHSNLPPPYYLSCAAGGIQKEKMTQKNTIIHTVKGVQPLDMKLLKFPIAHLLLGCGYYLLVIRDLMKTRMYF